MTSTRVPVGCAVVLWTSSDPLSTTPSSAVASAESSPAPSLPRANDWVLMGRRKASHGEGRLAFPGGWVEWGERLAVCAERELAEETGLALAELQVLPIAPCENRFVPSGDAVPPDTPRAPEVSVHSVTVFVGKAVSHALVAEAREPHKTDRWEWVQLCDVHLGRVPGPIFPSASHFVRVCCDASMRNE